LLDILSLNRPMFAGGSKVSKDGALQYCLRLGPCRIQHKLLPLLSIRALLSSVRFAAGPTTSGIETDYLPDRHACHLEKA
jgi:hypothetical protein